MRVLVHVEQKITQVADVWIEVDQFADTHDTAIDRAALLASADRRWTTQKQEISHGIGSYIKERKSA